MFFKLVSLFYTLKSRDILIRFKRVIRSKWLIPQFYSCGASTRFSKIGLIKGVKNISIGDLCFFEDYFFLTAISGNRVYFNPNGTPQIQTLTPTLTIGNRCAFGAFNHITCSNKITIGNNLLTGKWVTITDNSHGETSQEWLATHPLHRPVVSKGSVTIGNNVWIGEKATILPGVIIGDGVIIAANAVVTKDIPSFSIAAGNPANIIKQYQQNNK